MVTFYDEWLFSTYLHTLYTVDDDDNDDNNSNNNINNNTNKSVLVRVFLTHEICLYLVTLLLSKKTSQKQLS